jgi:hypothetical protein
VFVINDNFFWYTNPSSVEIDFQGGKSSNISILLAGVLAMLFEEFSIKHFFKFIFAGHFIWNIDI